jgi:hypothetical protein
MDPFNSNSASKPSQPPTSGASMGAAPNEQKKRLLQHLMQSATTGGVGRGIHDTVHAIKTALGAYKNYSKEVDALNPQQQMTPPQNMQHQMSPQQTGQVGQTPQMQSPMPQAPANIQTQQNATPTAPIHQQMVQPPKPVQQQPDIAPPMPAFMGGGHPAGMA